MLITTTPSMVVQVGSAQKYILAGHPTNSDTIFIGLSKADIAAGNYIPLSPSSIQAITIKGTIYAQAASGSQNLSVVQTNGVIEDVGSVPGQPPSAAPGSSNITSPLDPNGNVKVGVFGSGNLQVGSQPGTADRTNADDLLETFSLASFINLALSTIERARTPTTFKTIQASAAGATAVWTPSSGKKFRLMGVVISVAASLASSGEEVIQIQDAATTISYFSVPLESTMAQTSPIVLSMKGNGYLSSAANNALNINLGTVLASGHVSIFAYGTEE